MPTAITREGFQFFSPLPSPDNILGESIYVDSDRISQSVKYINKNNIRNITIAPASYKMDHLDFIRDTPEITGVNLQKDFSDLACLYALKGLRVLRFREVNTPFDLALFPELEVLSFTYSKKVQHTGACKNLTWLWIDGYKKDNLEELRDLSRLQYLNLYRSAILNLRGIENMEELKEIMLDGMRKLTSLEGLNKKLGKLAVLYIYGAKQLTHYEALMDVPSLKQLELRQTGETPSIQFLDSLPALEKVTLGCKVTDGNMSFLKRIGNVGFIDYPHYTHKMKDFQP